MGRTACALSVTYGDSSPKGRASGETAHFAVQLVTFPLCQGLSLWERWICEAKTERARTLAGEFPRQELNSLSQSLTALPAPSGREPLARAETLRLSRKLYRYAKGPISEDDFPRPGEDVTAGDKRGNLSSAARLWEFFHKHFFCTNCLHSVQITKKCQIFCQISHTYLRKFEQIAKIVCF